MRIKVSKRPITNIKYQRITAAGTAFGRAHNKSNRGTKQSYLDTNLIEQVEGLVVIARLEQVSALPLHPSSGRLELSGQLLSDGVVRRRKALIDHRFEVWVTTQQPRARTRQGSCAG